MKKQGVSYNITEAVGRSHRYHILYVSPHHDRLDWLMCFFIAGHRVSLSVLG